ncbi:MAG TPA: AGE family epimerase/isomerase [Bryobacteraceae bacterium]|nr:AGE family epimerase/isomerase [Bryobacteraceae bacterium]
MPGSCLEEAWLEQIGLKWLRAIEQDDGFAEAVIGGIAVRGPRTGVTQSRLGYCWSHLAVLFPAQKEFARAAEKSFRLPPLDSGARVYDHSFFLLFMAWYFRLTGDRGAIARLRERYATLTAFLDNAGAGGFGEQTPGIHSHNPYMHLLEALLAAFENTGDEYWLGEARQIVKLFFHRLRDEKTGLVFEFRNPDWSVTAEPRIEVGHQFEWASLLLAVGEDSAAAHLHDFAVRRGIEEALAINCVTEDGAATDRSKLLWVQTEAIRRGVVEWSTVRERFFHSNGWSWYNRLDADGAPVEEPSNARLLYHVITAGGAGSSGRPAFASGTFTRM